MCNKLECKLCLKCVNVHWNCVTKTADLIECMTLNWNIFISFSKRRLKEIISSLFELINIFVNITITITLGFSNLMFQKILVPSTCNVKF
jgi:hypothetical protein